MTLRNLHPAWFVLGVFGLLLLFLALRLGVKAAVLDETATITFYATHYIIASTKEGHSGSESDCYATPHHLLWVRLEVICQPGAAAPYRFLIAPWGQLIGTSRAPLGSDDLQAAFIGGQNASFL